MNTNHSERCPIHPIFVLILNDAVMLIANDGQQWGISYESVSEASTACSMAELIAATTVQTLLDGS
jgi:hypothetical protein